MPKYVYELVQCPFCEENRKSTGLHKHIKTHGQDKWKEYLTSKPTLKSTKIDDGFVCGECDFIGKTIQSASSHWWRNHTEEGKNHASKQRGTKYREGRIPWNRGLTKETDERIKKIGKSISIIRQKQILNGTYVPKKMGIKARQELSKRQSLRNSGGKSKWYVVAGRSVQGTYEKQFAEALEAEQIVWEKIKTNNHIFKYEQDGKIRSYAPDFYLPTLGLYVEIKGYWWGNDENKMKCIKEHHSDKNLVVIFGKDKLDKVCKNIREFLPLEPVWSW